MTDLLLQIVGFACLGHIITDFIAHFNLPELPDKPFRCDMCMGYWISIIPMCVQFGLMGILYSAMISVLANIIFKYTA